jgi:hypothetical protein
VSAEDVINSEDVYDSGPPPLVPPDDIFESGNAHRVLDDEYRSAPDRPRFEEKPEVTEKDKPKAGPPTLDEWQDFFARVVFLTLAEWYVTWCFRGIPDEVIDEGDLRRCTLSKEERKAIALPLSELANKSSVARKHGRQVIAFFETAESFILIGMWMAKVHRIAAKYKPKKEKKEKPSERIQPNQENPGRRGQHGVVYPTVAVNNPGVG